MGEDPSTRRAPVTEAQDPQEIQREIEKTRQDVGDTVEALAEKADVKAQAKRKIDEAKATVFVKKAELLGKAKGASPANATAAATRASQKAGENALPLAAVAAFAFGFLAGRASKAKRT